LPCKGPAALSAKAAVGAAAADADADEEEELELELGAAAVPIVVDAAEGATSSSGTASKVNAIAMDDGSGSSRISPVSAAVAGSVEDANRITTGAPNALTTRRLVLEREPSQGSLHIAMIGPPSSVRDCS
jgi:hypothetical protein